LPDTKTLTEREKNLYLREIKRDITYFGRSFQKAHMSVDITGCNAEEASRKVGNELAMALSTNKARAGTNARDYALEE
jgi:hypothetical protein